MQSEWHGKLITVHKTSLRISIRRFKKQTQTHNSKYDLQDLSSSQTIPSKFSKILSCRSVLDAFSGCRAPHLLVSEDPGQDFTLHEVLVCNQNGTFEECGLQFRVKKEDLLDCGGNNEDHHHLLHGPTVVWKQDTKVHIVHGEGMKQSTVDIESVSPRLSLNRIRNMWCMMSSSSEGTPSVLLLLQLLLKGADHSREFGAREWMCLRVQLPEGDFDFFPNRAATARRTRDVIPSDYGCIAKCISTHKEFSVDGVSGAVVERTIFAVGTEYRQVVLISDGVVKNVIPLEDAPQRVLAVKVRGTDDGNSSGV